MHENSDLGQHWEEEFPALSSPIPSPPKVEPGGFYKGVSPGSGCMLERWDPQVFTHGRGEGPMLLKMITEQYF